MATYGIYDESIREYQVYKKVKEYFEELKKGLKQMTVDEFNERFNRIREYHIVKKGYEDNIRNCINDLVSKTTEPTIKQFGPFNSIHEFYGVVKEEKEEVEDNIYELNSTFEQLWGYIKTNDFSQVEPKLYNMNEYCMEAIIELIQVMACIKKYRNGENKNG